MTTNWDNYFLNLCKSIGSNSKCLSRKIGAVLVKDNIVICTGYNGPARKIPDCTNRYIEDEVLLKILKEKNINPIDISHAIQLGTCPRQVLGFSSGQGLEWCNAIHAEKNCLLSAARLGICTKDSILYLDSMVSPCTQCFSACIQAGIKEIVVVKNNIYDSSVKWCMDHSDIIIREFNI